MYFCFMTPFTHLHVHSQYSILDGASSISSLVGQAKKFGMGAFALTDHGNMFGAKEFHNAMTEAGLKPILGCEVYVVGNHFERKDEKRFHLILLAKNGVGYHNLIKIVSRGWTEGFYYKPRVDFDLISQFHEGLICSSACIGGEVQQAILGGNMEKAEATVLRYKELFGEDYYLEMQLHRSKNEFEKDLYQKQLEVNGALRQFSKKHGIKLIVSNDSHFTKEEDAIAHDHLLCLNTGKDLNDPDRLHFTWQEYFKSGDEMAELFPDDLEALQNTMEVAEKVEQYALDHGPLMPNFPIPDNFDVDFSKARDSIRIQFDKDKEKNSAKIAILEQCQTLDDLRQFEEYTPASQFQYLEQLTRKGERERYGENPSKEVEERIDFELSTIGWMGFPGYFLIVWDLLRAAREMGVAVGPGRGSAAGSVVAYCLKITNIDPLQYDLLFERFLNPERISLPDVDMDFDEDGRASVIDYCIQKYGRERVAQITTFGTMAPKMAIKDVARIQKLDLSESTRLAKLIPDKVTPDKKKHETPFEWCYSNIPELRSEKDSPNPLVRSTLKYAEELEGTIRQTGVHACGVIIGQDDLEKFAPVATSKDADLNVVQYEGSLVESVGLIKMDFLGLKTLSIIKDALANIKAHTGKDVDIDNIPMNDPLTYKLYSDGETTGIFQFESPGMKKYLKSLQPSRFEDLIAMNALYRPGPLEKIPNFINRKKGIEEIKYELDGMSDYLEDTYGITVYQEQVMLLSQKLANFSKGQADTLRKAMGKKKKDVLDKMKEDFMKGAEKNGHNLEICDKIWKDWEAFASYAFNKSHATCYAYVSYQTAYLKANYPAEFMAALLSRSISDITKIGIFMDECRHMGINVLGPDINNSMTSFAVDKEGNIRFGLGAIKNVGEKAVDAILAERKTNGEFKDIYDFVERIPLQVVNKKNLENMAIAGAFDSIFPHHRSQLLIQGRNGENFLDALTKYGESFQTERSCAINSLFGEEEPAMMIKKPQPETSLEWNHLETLNREREVVGMYISAHPLDPYKIVLDKFCTNTTKDLDDLKSLVGKTIFVGGLITEVENLYRKNDQKPWGKVTIEDNYGSYKFAFFSTQWESVKSYCVKDNSVVIRATVEPDRQRQDEYRLTNMSLRTMNDILENDIKNICLVIDVNNMDEDVLNSLDQIIHDYRGKTNLSVRLVDKAENYDVLMTSERDVSVSNSFVAALDELGVEYRINS